VVEGGSSSSGLTSAPSTASDVEVRFAELKAQLHVQFKIPDASLSTIVEQTSSGDTTSAASTPLPVLDPVAVFGAGSATHDTAVDHATPESAASTPAPVPDLVAVFVAGSATHDTAVEQANFDDADFGDMMSEGGDEQPSTAYLAESEAEPGGSKDGKLNPTQFAAMKALKAKYKDNVRYKETRNAPSIASEALAQTVMYDLAETSTDGMLPESCENKWFQYGPCPRFVGQALPATGIIRPDAAFETGKVWITRQWEESRQVSQQIRLSQTLQERYSTLLSVLPPSTSLFYGDMPTIDEKIAGLLGLLALHRGEVVEISLISVIGISLRVRFPPSQTFFRVGASNFFACLQRLFLKPKELAKCAAASLWQRCRSQSARKEITYCNAGSLVKGLRGIAKLNLQQTLVPASNAWTALGPYTPNGRIRCCGLLCLARICPQCIGDESVSASLWAGCLACLARITPPMYYITSTARGGLLLLRRRNANICFQLVAMASL
jgi:hypothetical protein